MQTIYEPKGKAREYSPLALNLYTNCDHNCAYCYVKALRLNRDDGPVKPRTYIIESLRRDAPRFAHGPQVLISFLGDPYCQAEKQYRVTRQALEILGANNIPVALLTKGGTRSLMDLDILKTMPRVKVGATLTFADPAKAKPHEPDSAPPADRFEALYELHKAGIRTWASLEPVIDFEETLEAVRMTVDFVDEYKLGRTNYYQTPEEINYPALAENVAAIVRAKGKALYFKEDLRRMLAPDFCRPEESDPDRFALAPIPRT